MSQTNLDFPKKAAGPVEYPGQTFPDEEARREHYLNLLTEQLKDPEFRKVEGFPIVKGGDTLALPNPPSYTACPNTLLGEFIKIYPRTGTQSSLATVAEFKECFATYLEHNLNGRDAAEVRLVVE